MLNEKSLESLRKDDLLWRQLKTIPAFRALLRAVESRFYRQIELPGPTLDVGCGDGHFAQMTFDKKLTVGIDPWWGPLNKAQRSGMYEQVMQGMGDKMPFPDATFASAISNSVLEHIPQVQPVLQEINRVLKPGGKLVITMPSHLFTQNLGGAALLRPIGLADPYRRFFNLISRHAHTDSAEVWANRLTQAGFVVERWQYYFSTSALRALEVGHLQGLPSALLHFLTGQWIVAPWESSLHRTEQWVRPFYEEPFAADGAYVLFVARKVADSPIEAALPAARPFSLYAPLPIADEPPAEEPLPLPVFTPASASDAPQPTAEVTLVSPEPARLFTPTFSRFITGILVGLSLFCAVIGQSILGNQPATPSDGLWWYGYGAVALLLAVWQASSIGNLTLPSWRLPRIREVSPRRWLYLAGLAASWLAYRQVIDPANPANLLALFLWLLGSGLAYYALSDGKTAESLLPSLTISRFTLIITTALFLTAWLLRFMGLDNHPFIMNGTEASVGLDILNSRSPFATGWLTNPTLPYWLMQLPLTLFGRSLFSIRFLSPLVGALTVVATYLIGKKLWSQEVGLIAAVLLLGSHFHLHYSRLGVTNIWDPLLTLLALGLIGLAWSRSSRQLWLWAGTAVGLNAFFFTSSHLLPLMLLALLGFTLLFDRVTLRQQIPHLLLAAALALVILLPQWLYYRNHPTVFMERANNLGILDSQSGWLSAEAGRTGLSEGQILRQQMLKSVLAFHSSLDNSPSYRPQIPLLTFGPAVFSVLGLLIALFHLRQFRYQLLLVWLGVVVVFAGVLLIEPPSSHRLVIITPALALLAAVGLVEIGRLLVNYVATPQLDADAEQPPARQFNLANYLLPALLVLAVLFALNDVLFYFGRYRTQNSFADRNTEIADGVAHYLSDLGPGWTGYFYGPPSMYIGFPTIPFLATNFQADVNLFDVLTPEDKLPVSSNPNLVFIFLPERATELPAVQAAYPGGTETAVSGHYADPLFIIYEVTP